MEEFARLTFPNGRTGGPCVDEALVILHAITANWGTNGPARDRFYAFDKTTGELVWTSTLGRPLRTVHSHLLFSRTWRMAGEYFIAGLDVVMLSAWTLGPANHCGASKCHTEELMRV